MESKGEVKFMKQLNRNIFDLDPMDKSEELIKLAVDILKKNKLEISFEYNDYKIEVKKK